ncbi:hypothetical protein AcV5_003187 [Taiwanofungus camphoratus]|nr:hypothetical protein AcV5_003187 [Antrodia cinnamomea]
MLLLRDGTLYFILLLVLNISSMVLYLLNLSQNASVFTISVSTILISRFLLNVRRVHYSTIVDMDTLCLSSAYSYQTGDSRSRPSDVRFASTFKDNVDVVFDHEPSSSGTLHDNMEMAPTVSASRYESLEDDSTGTIDHCLVAVNVSGSYV